MTILNKLRNIFSRKPRATFTYHVRGKSKKATMINEGEAGLNFIFDNPHARIFPINDDFYPVLAKQFPKKQQLVTQIQNLLKSLNDLTLIENDLHKVQQYLDSFKKQSRKKNADAYLVAAIIMYMKAFTSTKHRVQLKNEIIPPELQGHQNSIKNLRDKFISHADLPANYESGQNSIVYDENELIILEPISLKVRLHQAEEPLCHLSKFVLKYVEDLSQRKRSEAQKQLDSLRTRKSR